MSAVPPPARSPAFLRAHSTGRGVTQSSTSRRRTGWQGSGTGPPTPPQSPGMLSPPEARPQHPPPPCLAVFPRLPPSPRPARPWPPRPARDVTQSSTSRRTRSPYFPTGTPASAPATPGLNFVSPSAAQPPAAVAVCPPNGRDVTVSSTSRRSRRARPPYRKPAPNTRPSWPHRRLSVSHPEASSVTCRPAPYRG